MRHIKTTSSELALIDPQGQALMLPVNAAKKIGMNDRRAEVIHTRQEAQLVDLELHDTRAHLERETLALWRGRRQLAR